MGEINSKLGPKLSQTRSLTREMDKNTLKGGLDAKLKKKRDVNHMVLLLCHFIYVK